MRKLNFYISKEQLFDLYWNKKVTMFKISTILNCSETTIKRRLKQFNIKIRNMMESKIGSRYTKKHRKNLSISHIGKLKGIALSPSHKKNISLSHIGKIHSGCFKRKELHWNWKGGATELCGLIRNLQESKIWKTKVFERDGYICQDCRQIGVYLEAHHIKQFSIILKEFLQLYNQFSPIEDKETLLRLAINYKPFWVVKNGKTLCEKCHSKYNKIKEFYK